MRITLLLLGLLACTQAALAQSDGQKVVPHFLMQIETTPQGIRLRAAEGCNFSELNFTLRRNQPQAIDQNGMVVQPDNPDNKSIFLFTIEKTKQGIVLKGLKGAAWKELRFTCPRTGCKQWINEMGMVEKKS